MTFENMLPFFVTRFLFSPQIRLWLMMAAMGFGFFTFSSGSLNVGAPSDCSNANISSKCAQSKAWTELTKTDLWQQLQASSGASDSNSNSNSTSASDDTLENGDNSHAWDKNRPFELNTQVISAENSSKDNSQNSDQTSNQQSELEKKREDYNQKILDLLQLLDKNKQREVCQENTNFIARTELEAKIKLKCQEAGANLNQVQGINTEENHDFRPFVIPYKIIEQ